MNSFSQPAVWSGPVMQRQRVKAGPGQSHTGQRPALRPQSRLGFRNSPDEHFA